MPPQRPLTEFLKDLGTDANLRKRFTRDRAKLLEQRGLENNAAFKDNATATDMKNAVRAEDPNGVREIAIWILVSAVPNDEFDPN